MGAAIRCPSPAAPEIIGVNSRLGIQTIHVDTSDSKYRKRYIRYEIVALTWAQIIVWVGRRLRAGALVRGPERRHFNRATDQIRRSFWKPSPPLSSSPNITIPFHLVVLVLHRRQREKWIMLFEFLLDAVARLVHADLQGFEICFASCCMCRRKLTNGPWRRPLPSFSGSRCVRSSAAVLSTQIQYL